MKTITGNLSYRKAYALQCLLKSPNPKTRSFDNCFEMGDGAEVVKHIMRRALEVLPPEPEGIITMAANSPEWKLLKRHATQQKLIRNLKEGGHWQAWYSIATAEQGSK